MLWVVAFLETRFNPTAVSPKGARGMMQFMPATAARYGLLDPHETVSAIDAAARYLRDLLQRYGQRVDLALAAYNAGEGAVDAALQQPHGNGIPPYRETQNYVRRGLQLLQRGTATPVLAASRASLPVVSRSAPSVPKNEVAEVRSEEAVPRGVVRQSVFMHRQTADAATQGKSLSRQSRYFGTRIDKTSYVPPHQPERRPNEGRMKRSQQAEERQEKR